jgi:hypothetical protein
MRFSKPPKTFEEQVDILCSRGMEIDDPGRARRYLSHLNYYRLAAYWLPFEQDHPTHRFQPGTRFNTVLEHYIFDRELRGAPQNLDRYDSLPSHKENHHVQTEESCPGVQSESGPRGPFGRETHCPAQRRTWSASKGSMSSMELRPIEQTKIECARKFFDEINRKIDPKHVKYDVVTSYGKLMEIVGKNSAN